jgi:hypothetical protein
MGQRVSDVSKWLNVTCCIIFYVGFVCVHIMMFLSVRDHWRKTVAWSELALVKDVSHSCDPTLLSMNGKQTGTAKAQGILKSYVTSFLSKKSSPASSEERMSNRQPHDEHAPDDDEMHGH